MGFSLSTATILTIVVIPPLTPDERSTLEANIVQAGRARDPLAVWNGVLLDGHNRFEICSRLGLPFDVAEVDGIEDRNDAISWICQHQLGRRNLDALTRIELALKREGAIAAKAAERLKLSPGRPIKGVETFPQVNNEPTHLFIERLENETEQERQERDAALDRAPKASWGKPATKTRDELGKVAGLSGKTIDKVKAIVERGTEAQKEALAAGKTTIEKEFKAITGAERKAEQVEAVKHASLPVGKYAVIVADPPWMYDARAEDVTHRAANPYPSMSIAEIKVRAAVSYTHLTLPTIYSV